MIFVPLLNIIILGRINRMTSKSNFHVINDDNDYVCVALLLFLSNLKNIMINNFYDNNNNNNNNDSVVATAANHDDNNILTIP